jgi:AcrR family transcriptional regulator
MARLTQYGDSMSEQRGYHHGDLRRAILDAALEVIATEGPAAVSLRDLARRADVSHAAPAHHFGTRAGLLTAIAVEGYRLLGEELSAEPTPSFLETGARYVRFALEHPAHFQVMYSPDLYDSDDPDLARARAATRDALQRAAGAGSRARQLAAWSLAHGFASLWASRTVAEAADGDVDPVGLFRTIARQAFQSGQPETRPHGKVVQRS